MITINGLCIVISYGNTIAEQDQAFQDALDMARNEKEPKFQNFMNIYYAVSPWKRHQEEFALALALVYAKTKAEFLLLTKVSNPLIAFQAKQKYLLAEK